jgi:hypothetical protein
MLANAPFKTSHMFAVASHDSHRQQSHRLNPLWSKFCVALTVYHYFGQQK